MYDCLVPLTAQRVSNVDVAKDEEKEDQTKFPEDTSVVNKKTIDVDPAQSPKLALETPIPACAKRVGWIFDQPQFYVNKKAHARDICQGAGGDSWFISSLASLCVDTDSPHLIKNIAPATCRNEQVGVYGFLFYRDGEWISEIVDDKLYLAVPDYDECTDNKRMAWDAAHSDLNPEISRKLWKQIYQSNSDALFFARCTHPQETWVPLIEKAFAKAHGDFAAIHDVLPG